MLYSKKIPCALALFTSIILFGCEAKDNASEITTSESQATSTDDSKVSKPGEYSGYSQEVYDGYQLTSRYIPMRDGTQIAIDIFKPTKNDVVAEEKLPVLWMHTPYNRRYYRDGLTADNYPGKALKLSTHGYIIAIADFRGLYASYGKNDGFNRGEWQDHARMDAYDITEWLAAQDWSTDKVGMWGCSATGGSQMQAITTAPPSLKAVFPMSCEWDVLPFSLAGGMSPPEGVPTRLMRGGSREARDKLSVPVDGENAEQQMAEAVASHENNIETAGYTPFRDSTAENFNSQWWLKSSPYLYKDTIEKSGVAVYAATNLNEGGTGYGAPFTYNNLSNPRKLIIGPGAHCDWTSVKTDTGFDILVEELRFFDYWLKGIDNKIMTEAPITYYTYNLENGNNGWNTASEWPLPNQKSTQFYLGSGSLGSQQTDGEKTSKVSIDYDVDDKNFWEKGLTFVTPPLSEDLVVTGYPILKLNLSTSANDVDVVARIDDLAPDGSHKYYMVEGRIRASLRKQDEAPYNNLGLPWHPFTKDAQQLLEPGTPVKVEFNFWAISYLFKAGHQIRLTLNFADKRVTPAVDPAPEVTIYHDGVIPSVLTLPVIPQG